MAVARVPGPAAPSRVDHPAAVAAAGPDVAGLVAQARTGDEEAWVQLYRHVFPGMYAFARRRLWNHEDAVDAVNETMARAVAAHPELNARRAGSRVLYFDRVDVGVTVEREVDGAVVLGAAPPVAWPAP